jgi:hypothetical protein
VVSGALGLARLICCGLVVVSFGLFALDQMKGASEHQVAEVTASAPTRAGTPIVGDTHAGQPRRFIDQAASVLTAPFRAVMHTGSQWAQRAFAVFCALLLYGVGLGYLARYSQGSA